MKIGAFQRFSLNEYPGKISAIIFTQGCNFRCPYCHNPELVKKELFQESIPEKEIFSFLNKRQNKLDAVSITGGEPTLHPDLPEFISKIKSMGFLVKLDTNGTYPQMLKNLIHHNLIDYIAMDIKAPLEKYDNVTKVNVDIEAISWSIDLIKNSQIEYEFRSTLTEKLLSNEEVINIGKLLGNAKRYYLQNFVFSKTLDKQFKSAKSVSAERCNFFTKVFKSNFLEFAIR